MCTQLFLTDDFSCSRCMYIYMYSLQILFKKVHLLVFVLKNATQISCNVNCHPYRASISNDATDNNFLVSRLFLPCLYLKSSSKRTKLLKIHLKMVLVLEIIKYKSN